MMTEDAVLCENESQTEDAEPFLGQLEPSMSLCDSAGKHSLINKFLNSEPHASRAQHDELDSDDDQYQYSPQFVNYGEGTSGQNSAQVSRKSSTDFHENLPHTMSQFDHGANLLERLSSLLANVQSAPQSLESRFAPILAPITQTHAVAAAPDAAAKHAPLTQSYTHEHNSRPNLCQLSSDSDDWSEPDREAARARIGIDDEATLVPSSPPASRRASKSKRRVSGHFPFPLSHVALPAVAASVYGLFTCPACVMHRMSARLALCGPHVTPRLNFA